MRNEQIISTNQNEKKEESRVKGRFKTFKNKVMLYYEPVTTG